MVLLSRGSNRLSLKQLLVGSRMRLCRKLCLPHPWVRSSPAKESLKSLTQASHHSSLSFASHDKGLGQAMLTSGPQAIGH